MPCLCCGASVCWKPMCGEVHHDVLREAVVQGSAYVGAMQPVCQLSGVPLSLLQGLGCY